MNFSIIAQLKKSRIFENYYDEQLSTGIIREQTKAKMS